MRSRLAEARASRSENVDVLVTTMPEGNSWGLTDLLGRDMGRIHRNSAGCLHDPTCWQRHGDLGCHRIAIVRFSRRRPGRDRGAHSGRMSPRAVSVACLLLVAAAAKRRPQADRLLPTGANRGVIIFFPRIAALGRLRCRIWHSHLQSAKKIPTKREVVLIMRLVTSLCFSTDN